MNTDRARRRRARTAVTDWASCVLPAAAIGAALSGALQVWMLWTLAGVCAALMLSASLGQRASSENAQRVLRLRGGRCAHPAVLAAARTRRQACRARDAQGAARITGR